MKLKKAHPLKEAADQCRLPPEVIVRFITLHWIVPLDRTEDSENQTLDEEDIARVRLIWQLQQDFGVNDEAIPIILRLIDQLNRTHLELKSRSL